MNKECGGCDVFLHFVKTLVWQQRKCEFSSVFWKMKEKNASNRNGADEECASATSGSTAVTFYLWMLLRPFIPSTSVSQRNGLLMCLNAFELVHIKISHCFSFLCEATRPSLYSLFCAVFSPSSLLWLGGCWQSDDGIICVQRVRFFPFSYAFVI